MQCRVTFQSSGRRGEVPFGTTVLEAGRRLGVGIRPPCGGRGVCGKCRVQVWGHGPEPGIRGRTSLSPLTLEEEKLLTAEEVESNYRLACQVRIEGDVLVSVPKESWELEQVILEAGASRRFSLNPAVRQYFIRCPSGSLADQRGDWERLKEALMRDYGLPEDLTIDYPALKHLPESVRQRDGRVAVTIWQNQEVVAVEPATDDQLLGVAIDLGTTTVVAYLCDLTTGQVLGTESMVNPQVQYGDDVLSRISYAINSNTGLADLHHAIIAGINSLLERLATHLQGSPKHIKDMVIVGNTTMHHLLLNINPCFLGRAPFLAAVQDALDLRTRDLGINISLGGRVHILPVEGVFVGADNVAVLIAEEPYRDNASRLVVDVGTNGEIALSSGGILAVTSCATGPALEGAQIKFGMRAAPGAIEKITIDPVTLEANYKVIGQEQWASICRHTDARGICGSGIVDGVAELFKAGVVSRNGRFNWSLPTKRLRKNEEGKIEFVIAWAEETAIGKDITITQSDVRAIQLAKAALYTGAKYLMDKLGVNCVDELVLAGAFGSYMNPENALCIGMFPDCPLERIRAVGNAAGDGAKLALLDIQKRWEAREVARRAKVVETAVEPDFQQQFMQAMAFPHARDHFPNLKHILEKIPAWHLSTSDGAAASVYSGGK